PTLFPYTTLFRSRSKLNFPLNRLLAKLPRSSSGSRDASASSSASRLPFDIFDVSITDAGAGFCGFAVVSSATCFSGASNDDFMTRRISCRRTRASSKFHRAQIYHPFSRDRSFLRQLFSNRNARQTATARRDAARIRSRGSSRNLRPQIGRAHV